MIASKRRVLRPDAVRMPLACIGSHDQTTGCPASRTARSSGGSASRTCEAPMRAISVSRPGVRSGSSLRAQLDELARARASARP